MTFIKSVGVFLLHTSYLWSPTSLARCRDYYLSSTVYTHTREATTENVKKLELLNKLGGGDFG